MFIKIPNLSHQKAPYNLTQPILNKGLTNIAGSQDIALNASSSSDTTRFMFQYQGGNQAWIERVNNTGDMAFSVASTEEMRLTANGLTFNGDTAAANALDDYEEGTWTIAEVHG